MKPFEVHRYEGPAAFGFGMTFFDNQNPAGETFRRRYIALKPTCGGDLENTLVLVQETETAGDTDFCVEVFYPTIRKYNEGLVRRISKSLSKIRQHLFANASYSKRSDAQSTQWVLDNFEGDSDAHWVKSEGSARNCYSFEILTNSRRYTQFQNSDWSAAKIIDEYFNEKLKGKVKVPMTSENSRLLRAIDEVKDPTGWRRLFGGKYFAERERAKRRKQLEDVRRNDYHSAWFAAREKLQMGLIDEDYILGVIEEEGRNYQGLSDLLSQLNESVATDFNPLAKEQARDQIIDAHAKLVKLETLVKAAFDVVNSFRYGTRLKLEQKTQRDRGKHPDYIAECWDELEVTKLLPEFPTQATCLKIKAPPKVSVDQRKVVTYELPERIVRIPFGIDHPVRIADRYEVQEVIGCGGEAIVYLCKDTETEGSHEELVAVKIPIKDKDLFRQSARTNSRLKGGVAPNICKVVDVVHTRDQPHIVMRYYESASVREIIERYNRLEPEAALEIMIQAAQGLASVEKIMPHLDLSDGNLVIVGKTNDGAQVKLLDFGLKQHEQGLEGTLVTREGSADKLRGTPGYVAPEILAKKTAGDFRSDLYSLGQLLFKMLAGQLPTGRELPSEVVKPKNVHLFKALDEFYAKLTKYERLERGTIQETIEVAQGIQNDPRFKLKPVRFELKLGKFRTERLEKPVETKYEVSKADSAAKTLPPKVEVAVEPVAKEVVVAEQRASCEPAARVVEAPLAKEPRDESVKEVYPRIPIAELVAQLPVVPRRQCIEDALADLREADILSRLEVAEGVELDEGPQPELA